MKKLFYFAPLFIGNIGLLTTLGSTASWHLRTACSVLHSQNQFNVHLQRQSTVTSYLKIKQLLLFVFAGRSVCQYSIAEKNPASQRQTAVTVS